MKAFKIKKCRSYNCGNPSSDFESDHVTMYCRNGYIACWTFVGQEREWCTKEDPQKKKRKEKAGALGNPLHLPTTLGDYSTSNPISQRKGKY